jgi:COMPASS component SPP1
MQKKDRTKLAEACGCPMDGNSEEYPTGVCELSKKKCKRHVGWERLKRAELVLLKLRQVRGIAPLLIG